MVPIEIIEQKYQSFDRLHLTTECSNQRRYPELCFYELVFDASCVSKFRYARIITWQIQFETLVW